MFNVDTCQVFKHPEAKPQARNELFLWKLNNDKKFFTSKCINNYFSNLQNPLFQSNNITKKGMQEKASIVTTMDGVIYKDHGVHAMTDSPNVSLHLTARGLITAEQLDIISSVLFSLAQVLNITGIVTNSLSIAVYIRLGFSDASNVSLLSLTIYDLVTSVLSLWSNFLVTPALRIPGLPFEPANIAILTGTGLLAFVIRGSAWVTAFISFERFLCVVLPLKVKSLVTPKVAVVSVLVITLLTVGPSIGVYWVWVFVWRFHPHLNRTILDVVTVDTPNIKLLEDITTSICGFVQPLLAFIIVVACTIFLTIHLRRSSAWRQGAVSGNVIAKGKEQTTRVSTKEKRVVKMVVVIAVIFIVCFAPNSAVILCSIAFKDFNMFGVHRNTFVLMFLISLVGQSFSASVNIFIYYKMASKYRLALRHVMGFDRTKCQTPSE